MFDIDTDTLVEIASSPQVLLRGAKYLREGRITDIFAECDKIHAKVQGSDIYNVILYFANGKLADYQCSCKAFENYEGACKHIIATLFYLHASESLDLSKEIYPVEDRILDEISKTFKLNKSIVKVEYFIELLPYQGIVGRMYMKLGTKRMYIVRNLKGFLESLSENKSFKFGKRFTFNPSVHKFSLKDRKIFEKLLEICELEKGFRDIYYKGKCFFEERYVNLPYPYLVKIAQLLKNIPIDTHIAGYTSLKATFETGKLPCEILIKQDRSNIIAKVDEDINMMEVNGYHGIYLRDNIVYLCDKKEPGLIFLKGFSDAKTTEICFKKENAEKLLSFIPRLENNDYINIDDEIKKLYVKAPMKLKMVVDGYKDGISVDVKFMYDKYEVEPCDKVKDGKIIVREHDKEQFVMNLLCESGFKKHKEQFILEDEDNIYNFAKEVAPNLTQLGDIYYADNVKNLFDIKTPTCNSVLKSVKGNLLEIDINFDNIDKKLAGNILNAIKEKKQYFRLKDGSFISLEDEKIRDLRKLLENVENKEIEKNTLHLSKYKMLGIMQDLEGEESLHIENASKLENIIDNVVNFPESRLKPPKSLAKILRKYQIQGFKWLKILGDNGLGGVLADDMGLGKTIQAISFILSNKSSENILPSIVIAPSTLVYNWEREIQKFTPNLSVLSIEGNKDDRQKKICQIPNYDVVITSYPLLRNDIDLYTEFDFYTCIIDEAQHIKNPASITAKSVKKINAHSRFALTGTPIENSPGELWSIFDFVMPGYLGTYKKFEKEFQKPILNGKVKVLDRLKKLITPFILRRSKEQVLKELPEKIVTTLSVELTPAQRRLYNAYLVKIKGELEDRIKTEGFEKSRMHIFTGLLRLRQICCHPKVFVENYKGSSGKIEALKELMQDMVSSGHRLLIFSQFTSMLAIIKDVLKKMDIRFSYLDGSTKVSERKRIVDDFNKGKSDVFLLSLKSGGTGLNLTSADTVIHFDPWWNPAVENQASDRVYRIGQKNKVHVIRLISRNTIEERIDQLQKQKQNLANAIVQDGGVLINTLSKEEILELFEVS